MALTAMIMVRGSLEPRSHFKSAVARSNGVSCSLCNPFFSLHFSIAISQSRATSFSQSGRVISRFLVFCRATASSSVPYLASPSSRESRFANAGSSVLRNQTKAIIIAIVAFILRLFSLKLPEATDCGEGYSEER